MENIKNLLGLADESMDDVLFSIISLTESRLCNLLGGVENPPESLKYIVEEVSVARYNRIGSEGLTSHTVEGETMSFSDDDFARYQGDIEAYNKAQTSSGKVRFI